MSGAGLRELQNNKALKLYCQCEALKSGLRELQNNKALKPRPFLTLTL